MQVHTADSRLQNVPNNSIICYNWIHTRVNILKYIRGRLKVEPSLNLGLVLGADEKHQAPIHELAQYFAFVFYNYHRPELDQYRNVYWYPLGWADGFGPQQPAALPLASRRKTEIAFYGSVRPQRAKAIDAIIAQGLTVKTNYAGDYGAAMADVRFGLQV